MQSFFIKKNNTTGEDMSFVRFYDKIEMVAKGFTLYVLPNTVLCVLDIL